MIYRKLIVTDQRSMPPLGLAALLRVDPEKINLLEKIGE